MYRAVPLARGVTMHIWDIRILDVIATLMLAVAILTTVAALGFLYPPIRRRVVALVVRPPLDSGDPASLEEEAPSEPPQIRGRAWFEFAAVVGGLVGAFLAVYVAYGTLRNQALLTAKTAINADAGRLLEWEKDRPYIRCLYNWYSTYDNGDACLAEIAASPDKYSEASIYIEEVFFILKQSKLDERQWGSDYIESIEYWRRGVEEDPTGLFANYLSVVDSYVDPPTSMAKAKVSAEAAGIEMPNMCDGYHRARACFQAVGQNVRESDACKAAPISQSVAKQLPKLVEVCRSTVVRGVIASPLPSKLTSSGAARE